MIYPPEGVKDVNDLLRERGAEWVRVWMQTALAPSPAEASFKSCEPPRRLPTATLAEAYAYHAGTMLQFYRPLEDGEQPP